jgi:CubicO group peptidase (beta-lactamase class C family)
LTSGKRIDSIDDLAGKYVPELRGHPYGETALRHLLTMSSGVKFSDPGADSWILIRKTLFEQGPGGADSVLAFTERADPPGTKFQYSSAESEVVSLVLRAVVGKPIA